jgi:spore coat polysaccharide biosynthesis predicted glycosyltransferase SpsG
MVDTRSSERVAFVLDSGGHAGWGHFARCSALAAEFARRGCAVGFAVNGPPPPFAREPVPPAPAGRVDIVVFDLHRESPKPDLAAWQGALVVCIVDGVIPELRYDVLVDPNVAAAAATPPRRLAGARYVIVRPEFDRTSAPTLRDRPERLLISFGGTSRPELIERAVAAIGASGVPFASVEQLVLHGKETRDMARLLAGIDAGLIAAGTTMHETCAVGVPCAVVSLTDDQADEARALEDRGAVLYLGPADQLPSGAIEGALAQLASRAVRKSLSLAGRREIDRRGRHRIVEAILQIRARR